MGECCKAPDGDYQLTSMLIYISGIDGCGKTTQAQLLVDKLRDNGIDARYIWLRWEPSIRRIIKPLRKVVQKSSRETPSCLVEKENDEYMSWQSWKSTILSNSMARKAWFLYACMDYYQQYLKKMNMFAPEVLIIDRYLDDFVIDQSINLGLPPSNVFELMENYFLRKFKKPDKRIIITIPPEEGYKRKMDGTSLKHLEKRSGYYQEILSWSNTKQFDGLKCIEELHENIFTFVLGELKRNIYE
jgi:thymidylate kinase